MPVTIRPSEGCEPELAALAGLAELLATELGSFADSVSLVLTSDLASTGHGLVPMRNFDDIVGGQGGLTVRADDVGVVVVLHCFVPDPGSVQGDFVAVHEAQHAMALLAGEADVTESFQRRAMSESSVVGFYTRLGGQVVDEFRAERGAVTNRGPSPGETTRDRYLKAAQEFGETLLAPSQEKWSHIIPKLFVACGYMAGETAATSVPPPVTGDDDWVTPWTMKLVELLGGLPPPTANLPTQLGDDLVDAVADLMFNGLVELGLGLIAGPGGIEVHDVEG